MANLIGPSRCAFRRVIFALIVVASLAACAPTDHRVIMRDLKAQLAQEPHQCVPLGWNPVPVVGAYYYPGFSARFADNSWLPPLWLGSVRTSELAHPQARATYEVLNELVRVGMLNRSPVRGGFHYRLTVRSLPYFFAQSDYGNDPDHIPYLCYSTIVPQRVIWNQPVHREQYRDIAGKMEIFRAAFQWEASPVADWAANDAMLRSHSVILPPTRSPAVAKFVDWDGSWEIDNVSTDTSDLPLVVKTTVWPRPKR